MTSIFNKLKQGLSKTSEKISHGIDKIFYQRKIDNNILEELEELLISADIGSQVSKKIIDDLRAIKFDKEVDGLVIKRKLEEVIQKLLDKVNKPFILNEGKLNVILVCGVNGAGKTTTIGKLAAIYKQQGKKIAVAACDTFRAAAINQLNSWVEKAGVMLISGESGADPASVAYQAMQESIKQNIDILFIDTAGRLHNKKNLMDELGKIVKVIKKLDSAAPHHTILVIDSTTGQNVYNQIEQFNNIANINGLIVTKLDGTAKAGVIIGVTTQFSLPVYFIGIGERIDDLRPFDSAEFAHSILN